MDDNPIHDDVDELKDAWPVCPSCMTPCDPKQYYCTNCQSYETINPLTPYMPFVNIGFAVGFFRKLWRKCWYSGNVPIALRCLYIFVLLFCFPYILIVGVPFLLTGRIKDQNIRTKAEIALTIFFITAVCIYFLMLFANG